MIPTYLFTDPGFWIFSLLYSIAVAITTALIVWPLTWRATRPRIVHAIPRTVILLFAALIVYQFFHQAEHVTQMYQFKFLNMASHESHGILWFFDEEWNHFSFNLGYTLGITAVFVYIFKALRRTRTRWTFATVGYMFAFWVWEGWHLVEHTYRISQHIQGLCDSCPGIIDTLFPIDRLVLHFWFNFVALILPVAVFVWYRLHTRLKPST